MSRLFCAFFSLILSVYSQTCDLTVLHQWKADQIVVRNDRPSGIAVGPDGSIYFAEPELRLVRRRFPDGSVVTIAGTGEFGVAPDGTVATEAKLGLPRSVALDKTGRVYFTDGPIGRIRRIELDGKLTTIVGGDGSNYLGFIEGKEIEARLIKPIDPTFIAVADDGGFTWLDDNLNGNAPSSSLIYPVNAQGIAKPFSLPWTRDIENYHAAYLGSDALYIITNQYSVTPPSLLTLYSLSERKPIPIPGMTNYSRGPLRSIAVSPDQTVYFASMDGEILRLANGELSSLYGGDGQSGITASGLAVLPDGSLAIADSPKKTLYRLTTSCSNPLPPFIRTMLDAARPGSSPIQRSFAIGQIVSFFGSNMGPLNGIAAQFDQDGNLPRSLSGTRLLVNGKPAPLLYVGAEQVNAILPFDVTPDQQVDIQVEFNGMLGKKFSPTLKAAAPSIWTYPSTIFGSSIGPAIAVNQDGSLNTEENPAKAGSIVALFATGVGQMSPPAQEGKLVTEAGGQPALPFEVRANGQLAETFYAGYVPGTAPGIIQINVRTVEPRIDVEKSVNTIGLKVGTAFVATNVFVKK